MCRAAETFCFSAAAQTFSYDTFGNISKSGSPYSFQPTYNAATNRFATIPGATPSYDANGNVLGDGSHTYTWDADGNSVTLDTVGLTFDALDRMVEQNRSGAYTEIVYAPTGGKLALMNGQSLVKAFVPLPGGATAVYTSTGLDHYRHSDWLGSARLTSSPSRTYLSSVAYAPFGETYAASGTTDPSFTGMNPDTVSTDYDFLFREYSTQGRWASPDPAGFAAVDPSNPQSWNRYSYVLNDPMNLIDPLGLDWECFDVTVGGQTTTRCHWVDDGPSSPLNLLALQRGINCGQDWIVVSGDFGQPICVPNHMRGDWARTPKDRDGWWRTFGRTFINGVLHGVRNPGESRGACILRNADETTGGQHDKLLAAAVWGAYSASALLTQVSAPQLGSVPGSPGSPSTWTVVAQTALIVGRAFQSPAAATGAYYAGAGIVWTGTALAGAEAGLLIGSAINCR